MSRRGIFWLASYPKSGNTWVRCLIASLRSGATTVDIDTLGRELPNAASRSWLQHCIDVDNADLSAAELDLLRCAAYRQCAAQRLQLLKVHDRYNPAIFPAEATLGTVCIVRDPRDIAPSWADHLRVDLDTAIGRMADPHFTISQGHSGFRTQAQQCFGSWSAHVTSWLQRAPGPRLLLHYEALQAQPLREAARLADFLGLPTDAQRLQRAVAACRFETLRSAEQRDGFVERSNGQAHFFRQGRAGAWRTTLTPQQAARLLADHGPTMTWLGY